MEVGGSSCSPLEGATTRQQRTIIHLDYGGHYAKKGGEIIWIPREEYDNVDVRETRILEGAVVGDEIANLEWEDGLGVQGFRPSAKVGKGEISLVYMHGLSVVEVKTCNLHVA